MKVHKIYFFPLIAALLVIGLQNPAAAFMVKNLTTDTVIYYDDFEGVSPVSTMPYPDPSGSYDPDNGIYPGYCVPTETNQDYLQVTNFSEPGAFEGNQYLRMNNLSSASWSMIDFYYSEEVATAGNLYHAEFMANLPATAQVQFYFRDSSGLGVINLITNKKGLQLCCYDAVGYGPVKGVSYTPDTWQKWEINYEIGTWNWTLTIDDVTSNPANTMTNSAMSTVYIRIPIASTFYMDSTPYNGLILPGDANRNGTVDEDDAAILAENWLRAGDARWVHGDFNDDGNVDDADATLMATNWGRSTLEEPTSVPEPSVGLLLIFAGLAFSALIRCRS